MIGGGIRFSQKEPRSINKCIIAAMLRPDTQINPLTFSSMAGFIFTLHRPGGLVDESGNIFIQSDNIGASGDKKSRAGSGGAVVSTLVIKIVLKQNDPAHATLDNLQLVLPGEQGYDLDDSGTEKSSLDPLEITTEQKNHNELYQTFHLGEKMVPSLVGDLIDVDAPGIQTILTAIQQKTSSDPVKRAKVIRVFEYFASQIRLYNTSVVMMCMEMVGEDTKSEGVNTYQVTSSIVDRKLKLAAARGACAIQLLCMRKSNMELVDAHEGNWFIDTTNRDNVRAIDFGRLQDITNKNTILEQILEYKKVRQSSFSITTSQPTFLSNLTEANLRVYYDRFINILEQKSPLPFLIEMSRDRSHPIIPDQKSRFNVHRNIHFCLVFAALIDNAITSLSYPDWDQAQMIWAYEAIWGIRITKDVHKKYPLHHIPTLDFDYDTFMENMKTDRISPTHVIRSYDEIARLISLYTSTPHETAAETGMSQVAAGITAEHMGDFVPFSSVAPPPCRAGRGGLPGCSVMGGSRSGRRYNKSKTRRSRRYSKSKTRRGRRYHRRAHQQ